MRGGWQARPRVDCEDLSAILRRHITPSVNLSLRMRLPEDEHGMKVAQSTKALEVNFGILKDVFEGFPHGPPAPKDILKAWSEVAHYSPKKMADTRLANEDATRVYDLWQYAWKLTRRSKGTKSNSKKVEALKTLLSQRLVKSPSMSPATSNFDYTYPTLEPSTSKSDAEDTSPPEEADASDKDDAFEDNDMDDGAPASKSELVEIEDTDSEESPREMEKRLLEVEKEIVPVMMRRPAAAVLRKPSAAVSVIKKPAARTSSEPAGGFILKKSVQRGRVIMQVFFRNSGRAAVQVQGLEHEEQSLRLAGDALLAAAQAKKWKTPEACKAALDTLKKSEAFWEELF